MSVVGKWHSIQVALSACELCCHVAYCEFMTWQFIQAFGSLDRYESALEAFTKYTNKPIAIANTASELYTRNLLLFTFPPSDSY